MVYDMHEPCTSPSHDSYQKMFLRYHKKVDLAPHPVVGLVLQVGDAEKFPQALGFESLDPLQLSRVYVSQPQRRMEVTRLVRVELACETDGAALPDPV